MRKPLAILAVLAVLPALAAAQEASLSERLAERLVAPWGDQVDMTYRLLPGALPSDLGFELPLPEGSELLGSFVRRSGGGELLGVQVVVDAPQRTETVLDFFATALAGEGWSHRIDPLPMGFLPSQANLSGMFCSPADEAFMYVNAFHRREAPTDVRLDLNFEAGYSPCPEFASASVHHGEVAPLPTLIAPEESVVTVHGGAMMEGQSSSMAVIEGAELGGLRSFYEGQLRAQGWTPTAGGWSRRAEDGRRWRAVLALEPVPGVDGLIYGTLLVVEER